MGSIPASWGCPPNHRPWTTEQLALNQVLLHQLLHPDCTGYNAWPCHGHWHTGHSHGDHGATCKP